MFGKAILNHAESAENAKGALAAGIGGQVNLTVERGGETRNVT